MIGIIIFFVMLDSFLSKVIAFKTAIRHHQFNSGLEAPYKQEVKGEFSKALTSFIIVSMRLSLVLPGRKDFPTFLKATGQASQ